jgi:hypothetical protein
MTEESAAENNEQPLIHFINFGSQCMLQIMIGEWPDFTTLTQACKSFLKFRKRPDS